VVHSGLTRPIRSDKETKVSAILAVYISVENADRARDVIEHGTLLPFIQVHERDLSCRVIEEDDNGLLVEV